MYPPPNRVPWFVAGAAIAALVLVLVLPDFRAGGRDGFSMGASPLDFSSANSPMDPATGMDLGVPPGGGTPGGGAPPALSDDPRVNADRLFNRIMQEREGGDTERAQFFLPMALQAYQLAEPLDDDGLFHVALLQSAGGLFGDARATAERILARNADHLLALAAAGEAMLAAGDTAAARGYYQRYLDAYDREREKVYPEYIDHAQVLPGYERTARALLGR